MRQGSTYAGVFAAPGSEKKIGLFYLCDLLVSARNGLNSGSPVDLIKLAESSIETSVLFLNHTCRELFFNTFGLFIFFASISYDICIGRSGRLGFKKIAEEHFDGKGLRTFISFFAGMIGALLLYSQRSETAEARDLYALQFGTVFLAFAGYLSGEGDALDLAKQIRKKIQEDPSPEQLASLDLQLGQAKGVLDKLIQLVVSYRAAALSGGAPDLVIASTAETLPTTRLALNYALIEIFFGGFITAIFAGSLIYNVLSGRAKRVGFEKLWDEHFSGKRTQLFFAACFSLTGALLMLYKQSDNPNSNDRYALEFARLFLYCSGFFTAPKEIVNLFTGQLFGTPTPPTAIAPFSDIPEVVSVGATATEEADRPPVIVLESPESPVVRRPRTAHLMPALPAFRPPAADFESRKHEPTATI